MAAVLFLPRVRGVRVRGCWGHVWLLSHLRLPRATRRREQPRGHKKEKINKTPIPYFCMPWRTPSAARRLGRPSPPALRRAARSRRACAARGAQSPRCPCASSLQPPARLWGLRLGGCAPAPGSPSPRSGPPPSKSRSWSRAVPAGVRAHPRVLCSRLRLSAWQGGPAASRRVAL